MLGCLLQEPGAKQSSLLRYGALAQCSASNHGQTPRTAGLLSASFPTELRFVPFFCAVAMTEYGNMFINLLHQSQPCDKAYPSRLSEQKLKRKKNEPIQKIQRRGMQAGQERNIDCGFISNQIILVNRLLTSLQL